MPLEPFKGGAAHDSLDQPASDDLSVIVDCGSQPIDRLKEASGGSVGRVLSHSARSVGFDADPDYGYVPAASSLGSALACRTQRPA